MRNQVVLQYKGHNTDGKVNGRQGLYVPKRATGGDPRFGRGGRQGLYFLKRQLEGTPTFCREGTTGAICPKKATGGDPRFGRGGRQGLYFLIRQLEGTPECQLHGRSSCFTTLGDDGMSKTWSIQLVDSTRGQQLGRPGTLRGGDDRGFPKKATGGDPSTTCSAGEHMYRDRNSPLIQAIEGLTLSLSFSCSQGLP
jgi:hypothetical protein